MIVKRIDSGEELSEADIEALLEEALGEADLHEDGEMKVEVIVKKLTEESEDDAE